MTDTDWTLVKYKKKRLDFNRYNYDPVGSRSDADNWRTGEGTIFTSGKNPQESKITEPCWFYNNGGCKHKDGTDKLDTECKYQHIVSTNVKRPPHLLLRKPCDKLNLEGQCRWDQDCKYSHRKLTDEEMQYYYGRQIWITKNSDIKEPPVQTDLPLATINKTSFPSLDSTRGSALDKTQIAASSGPKTGADASSSVGGRSNEKRLDLLEEKIKTIETKYDGMSRDMQMIGQMIQKYIKQQVPDKTLPL